MCCALQPIKGKENAIIVMIKGVQKKWNKIVCDTINYLSNNVIMADEISFNFL